MRNWKLLLPLLIFFVGCNLTKSEPPVVILELGDDWWGRHEAPCFDALSDPCILYTMRSSVDLLWMSPQEMGDALNEYYAENPIEIEVEEQTIVDLSEEEFKKLEEEALMAACAIMPEAFTDGACPPPTPLPPS